MNHLLIGAADKTQQLLEWADKTFLLIDDGPIADAFLEHFPARLFDVTKHTFNPLKGIDHKAARDLAATIYSAFPEGKDTLTVRNGRRALARLVLDAERIDRLPERASEEPGVIEAHNTIEDILLSPVLKRVLCGPTNFSFRGGVVAKLDRSVIGDLDAFILGSLLIGHFQGHSKGHVIVPDFGFYGREHHVALIRQDRLIAGVHFLDELPEKLRQASILIQDKAVFACTPEDAEMAAQFLGLTPGTVAHTDFVRNAVGARDDRERPV